MINELLSKLRGWTDEGQNIDGEKDKMKRFLDLIEKRIAD
jgi:hypothetical protein